MLLHISPDHHHLTVLSIPRDTMVRYAGCPAGPSGPGQQASLGRRDRINQTFANGGVRICLPTAVSDPDSGLNLTAGVHHVMGAQALAFWRERHIGLGSDLQRIRRDQYVMASMVRSVAHADLLGSPARLYAVLIDTARAMTTDAGLDPGHDAGHRREPAQPVVGVGAVRYGSRGALSARSAGRDQIRATAGRRARTARPGTAPVGKLARTYGGITGSARTCGDQAAFAGGDVPADFPSP